MTAIPPHLKKEGVFLRPFDKFVNDSKETSDTLILPVRELAKEIAYNYKQINVEEDERLL